MSSTISAINYSDKNASILAQNEGSPVGKAWKAAGAGASYGFPGQQYFFVSAAHLMRGVDNNGREGIRMGWLGSLFRGGERAEAVSILSRYDVPSRKSITKKEMAELIKKTEQAHKRAVSENTRAHMMGEISTDAFNKIGIINSLMGKVVGDLKIVNTIFTKHKTEVIHLTK